MMLFPSRLNYPLCLNYAGFKDCDERPYYRHKNRLCLNYAGCKVAMPVVVTPRSLSYALTMRDVKQVHRWALSLESHKLCLNYAGCKGGNIRSLSKEWRKLCLNYAGCKEHQPDAWVRLEDVMP